MKISKRFSVILLLIFTGMGLLCGCRSRTVEAVEQQEETEADSDLVMRMKTEAQRHFKSGQIDTFYDDDHVLREFSGKVVDEKIFDEKSATAVLAAMSDLFGISEFHYACEKEDTGTADRNGYCLTQLYKGVPVENGVFHIYTTADGEIQSGRGHYVALKDLDVKPQIEAEKAVKIAKTKDVQSVSLILAQTADGQHVLAWKVSGKDGQSVFINAADGSVIKGETPERTGD